VPKDDEGEGDMPNADDPCDADEKSSAEERRRNSGGCGAVLGRRVACGSVLGGTDGGADTISVGEPEVRLGAFSENSEEDRVRPPLGGNLPGPRVFERVTVADDLDESIGWDCEMGRGEAGEDVVGVSLGKATKDGVPDGGVLAGEVVVGASTPRNGENCAIDVEGRRGREGA
jgi:hypothetical protein